MNILLVAPMPPQPQATGAIPLVLYAQLTGLMSRHTVTLVTVAGPDRSEWAALDRLQIMGVDIQAVRRSEPRGLARWQRRWRWASTWLKGKVPWRTIWFWEPELQPAQPYLEREPGLNQTWLSLWQKHQSCLNEEQDWLLMSYSAKYREYNFPGHLLLKSHCFLQPAYLNFRSWYMQG